MRCAQGGKGFRRAFRHGLSKFPDRQFGLAQCAVIFTVPAEDWNRRLSSPGVKRVPGEIRKTSRARVRRSECGYVRVHSLKETLMFDYPLTWWPFERICRISLAGSRPGVLGVCAEIVQIQLHAVMNNTADQNGKWNERSSAVGSCGRQDNSMFELLFERTADAIWLFDPATGVFVDCNRAAVELMGAASKEELLQARPEDLSPAVQPDGSPSGKKIRQMLGKSKEGGSRFEWEARRLDGRIIPMEVLTTPIPTNGHTLYVVVSRDISERKRAEAVVRESQQLLASVADNISEAIYRSGPDHRLIFVNQAFLRLFGYDSLTELQSTPRDRLYADPPTRMRLLELLASEGAFSHEEVEYVRKDGTRFWGLSSARVIRDSQSGKMSYQVGGVTDITARKQDEAEIRRLNQSLERRIEERTAELSASEARLRTLVDHAPEAIVVFDGETRRFLFGNAHACRLYGVTPEQLSQLTPMDVSPELQLDGRRSEEVARELIGEALRGGTPIYEWVHRQPSGKLVPTEVRLVKLPGENKRLLRASIIDNSERKRREIVQHATFQISEAAHTAHDLPSLFRQIHQIVKGLMAAENFFIALADPGGQTVSFPYSTDEHGFCVGQMPIGKGLTGFVMRTARPVLGRIGGALKPGGTVDMILDTGEKVEAIGCGQEDGVWLGVPLSIEGRPFGVVAVQDYQNPQAYGQEEKLILGFVAGQIALAIERKRADQALRESEEKFRALFEASSQGVMLHDDKQYLEVNPAALRILGYRQADDLIGRHPRDTSPPFQPNGQTSDALATQHIADCMAKGSTRFDWMARSAGGRDIPLEVILTRVEWRGRQLIQAVINDITARKQAEAELLRALAREKELGQLKSNFVSMVSHEFRTPLGVIMSSAEILENYFEELNPVERRDQLKSIQKNTRRMASLMEEVLLLGMVEAGKMDYQPALIPLENFCERLVGELMLTTDRKCPVFLATGDLADEAFGDERLLRHIFSNLLSNALKYSPEGSRVDLEIEREGPDAVCRIRDRGRGIPEQDLEWLFRAFHRGRNVGQVPGSGLGLTIVKRCVELHRGAIQIQSKVGEGTVVTVRLPLFAGVPAPTPELAHA
jgi:PAS domain S-box-containing protein